MSDKNLIKKLQGINFLHDIAPTHLEQIANISEARVYDASDILFHEGEPAEYVYLVVTGKIMLEL
jgi:CRP-like cAMP-binding protein